VGSLEGSLRQQRDPRQQPDLGQRDELGLQDDQDALLEAELDAIDSGETRVLSPAEVTGRVAGRMAPGPGLAALLGAAPATDLTNYALPDAAADFRRIASWAQARELACVAQIAARAAVRDPKIGADTDGRPARISREACAEVSLALMMTGIGAQWWTDLAVTLSWRLAATGAALHAGEIDLSRARLIAEATSFLDEDAARAVEEEILPGAGNKTTGSLRAALRRAVIAADPDGAERRRAEAERRARVVLYPDADSTATLAGQSLPGVHAATAMARIKAIARAWKASGAAGSLDFLCAQVFVGMLLGTLPAIQPAQDAPADDEHPDDEPPDKDPPPGGSRPPACGADPSGPARGGRGGTGAGPEGPGPGGGLGDVDDVPWPDAPADYDDDDCESSQSRAADGTCAGASRFAREDDEWPMTGGSAQSWPDLPAGIPPGLAVPGGGVSPSARAVGQMLDLSLPWATLAGISPEPGSVSRLGPITPMQSRQLAELASRDPAVEWRVILTNAAGQARAVARIPRPRAGPGHRSGPGRREGPGRQEEPQSVGGGPTSRVTLTVSESMLDEESPPGGAETGGILAAALRAASRARARADTDDVADAAAGGCAHLSATTSYRPPPSLRDYVAARDVTCRYPTCRRPAWHGDLDHTLAYEDGGRTCKCNMGGLCREHHLLKQNPFWVLQQSAPGIFNWTTPAGRLHAVTPDIHPG
jgi:hypothetical protein